jgi:flotillin
VHALIVEAQAQVQMQEARMRQVRLQLDADVLRPANAKRLQAEENAKADAAKVVQRGLATAQALSDLAAGYAASGESGRDALLLQKLLPVTTMLAEIGSLRVERMTVLGTSGNTPAGEGLAAALIRYNEQIRAATGIDLTATARERLTIPVGSPDADAGENAERAR